MHTKRWSAVVALLVLPLILGGCFLLGNREPEASFTVGYGVDPADPLIVELDASGSWDPDDDPIVAYSWVFGDDITILAPQVYTATVQNAVLRVRFPVEDSYTITLVVRDDSGASSLPVSETVTVPNVPVSPTQ